MPTVNNNNLLKTENPNTIWASIFVEELAKGGLKSACIAPGSRSTPLALAFYAQPNIKVYTQLDERSAAFFALGKAIIEEKTVALLCTSGTAAANFHPAIIEAQMSHVPLLILTADRPHELRQSGANQTIDQVKMFGDHVLWSVDMAAPQADSSETMLRHLRTLAARVLSTANGLVKGPVHINFPFRKPLEPTQNDWLNSQTSRDRGQPHTLIEHGALRASASQISYLSEVIEEHQRGLIICGPQYPAKDFAKSVAELSRVTGFPILADPLSGVRYGAHVENTAVLGGYETFLQNSDLSSERLDIILRFGKVPTSKWLNNYLENHQSAIHIHIRHNGVWADGTHTTNYLLQAEEADICSRLARSIRRPVDSQWLNAWLNAERIWQETISQIPDQKISDVSIAATVLEQLPQNGIIFSGNSLAIRHLDQFCPPQKRSVRLFSNRGASGIDGNLSTGLGIAVNEDSPVVLLVGDITFYHDSNGLLAIRKYGIENVIIIILNNNGGGIFRRLPVSQFEPAFEDLFVTPHGLQFDSIAKLYNLDYYRATDLSDFVDIFNGILKRKTTTIIEVQTDSRLDEQMRRKIVSIVNSKIAEETN